MTYPLKIFLAVSITLFGSCNGGQSRIDPKVMDVFSDFDFVGYGPATFEEKGELDSSRVVAHGDIAKSVPVDLEVGVQYVFHYRGGRGDPQRLGRELLPSRLRALGLDVTQAPGFNGGEFAYPYIGGPYFSITFEDGVHRAVIFNRVHGEVPGKNWIVEDYILVFVS